MPARWPTNTTRVVTQDNGPSSLGVEPTRFYERDAGGELRSYKTAFPGSQGVHPNYHDGLDIRAYANVPLVAVLPGTVKAVPTWDTGIVAWGKYRINYGIVVRADGPFPYPLEFCFWHCTPGHFAAVGKHVALGEVIAWAGRYGAKLAHCHFGIYIYIGGVWLRYNPERFMPAHKLSSGVLVPQGDLYDSPLITPRLGKVTPTGTVANVRSDPSTANPPLGSLAAGLALPYVAVVTGKAVNGNPDWFQVDSQGRWGFMSATVVKTV